jgi:hypothetical protein
MAMQQILLMFENWDNLQTSSCIFMPKTFYDILCISLYLKLAASFNQSIFVHMHLFHDHGLIVLSYICDVVIYYSRYSVVHETILREMTLCLMSRVKRSRCD